MENATFCISMERQVTKFGKALLAHGWENPAQFADEFGFPDSTVRSYSNGTRPITIEAAMIYADKMRKRVPGMTWAMLVPDELVNKLRSELLPQHSVKLLPVAGGGQIEVPVYNSKIRVKGTFKISEASSKDRWVFSRNYLADELHLPVRDLVVFEIVGDSMKPTLVSGDRVLVNQADQDISPPGIFMVLEDGKPVARRLDTVPGKPKMIARLSDNPKHPAREAAASETEIIGRVVWYARRI